MRRAALLLIALFAACGDDDPAAPPDDQVWASGSAFVPDNRTIHTSETVTWVNQDGVTHNITSSDVPTGAATFAMTLAPSGGTATLTPTIAGVYQYYCTIHGTPTTGMHGTLTVVVP